MIKSTSANDFRLLLRFWGVRGSTPAVGMEFSEHGGNTACVEVRLPSGEALVFDGGTGVRNLGKLLMRETPPEGISFKFFLTHFHWDHIQGIPFFLPLYSKANSVTFYSFRDPAETQQLLTRQMSAPFYPVDFKLLPPRCDFTQVTTEPMEWDGVVIRPFPMNHPQCAYGYRVEHQGASIVYASDLEHGHAELDKVVREYARNADILIYDAQFTLAEYEARKSWGHSTWLEATKVARDAGVKKLILIHHDPEHDDGQVHQIVDLARGEFDNTEAAREGMVIKL